MLWVKAFHIVFVASWFAGLFYLPRIFVNLAMVAEQSVAERDRLLLMARKWSERLDHDQNNYKRENQHRHFIEPAKPDVAAVHGARLELAQQATAAVLEIGRAHV